MFQDLRILGCPSQIIEPTIVTELVSPVPQNFSASKYESMTIPRLLPAANLSTLANWNLRTFSYTRALLAGSLRRNVYVLGLQCPEQLLDLQQQFCHNLDED